MIPHSPARSRVGAHPPPWILTTPACIIRPQRSHSRQQTLAHDFPRSPLHGRRRALVHDSLPAPYTADNVP